MTNVINFEDYKISVMQTEKEQAFVDKITEVVADSGLLPITVEVKKDDKGNLTGVYLYVEPTTEPSA